MNTVSSLARQVEFRASTQAHSLAQKIPRELVAVAAYHLWRERCEELGEEVHGYDKDDWLEAELEIRNTFRSLTGLEFELFAGRIRLSELQPSQERIAVRAYFISQKNRVICAQECWQRALEEEREIVFASLFLDFCRIITGLGVFSGG